MKIFPQLLPLGQEALKCPLCPLCKAHPPSTITLTLTGKKLDLDLILNSHAIEASTGVHPTSVSQHSTVTQELSLGDQRPGSPLLSEEITESLPDPDSLPQENEPFVGGKGEVTVLGAPRLQKVVTSYIS